MNTPASLTSASLFITLIILILSAMAQLTPAGLLLCAFCCITQVWSQGSTISPSNSTALTGNQTGNANDTMATDTYGSPAANATTAPTGAGVHTRAGAFSALVPIAMATGLLRRCC